MKTLILITLIFGFLSANTQELTNENGKQKSNEKTIAKHQVIVKLEKKIDENGKEIIVSETTELRIPDSFPKYIDTGNPKVDRVTYHEAKMKWAADNPKEFEKIKHLKL